MTFRSGLNIIIISFIFAFRLISDTHAEIILGVELQAYCV